MYLLERTVGADADLCTGEGENTGETQLRRRHFHANRPLVTSLWKKLYIKKALV